MMFFLPLADLRQKKIDIFGNYTDITDEEVKEIPSCTMLSDAHIKRMVQEKIKLSYKGYSQKEIKTKAKESDLQKKIKPFILSETIDSVSLLLDVGVNKNYLFENNSISGYDWQLLAKTFLKENVQNLASALVFDSEADMFCVRSENKEALFEFSDAFHSMCENKTLMMKFLSRIKG